MSVLVKVCGLREKQHVADAIEAGAGAVGFVFAESPRSLHVCNAPSPAATSALPIGELICDRVMEKVLLQQEPGEPKQKCPAKGP